MSGTVGSTSDALKGKAATFSPTTPGSLRVNDNPQVSTGDIDFTLVAHVYLNSSTGTTIIANKGEVSNMNNRDFTLAYSASAFSFRVGNGTDGGVVTSGTVSINAWHTIFAWHDAQSNSLNIQVDNGTVNDFNYSGGAKDTTFPLTIGAFADNTYVFNGQIDEVALYKRVLTAAERGWLYNNAQAQGRAYRELLPTSAITHGYGDAAHTHAVTHINATQQYWYDQNGNQKKRIVGGQTSALEYDAENRLIRACQDTSSNGICDAGETVIAQFTYDGDGKEVKAVVGTTTTYYVGAHYQVDNGVVTKYYFAGAQRVAMRTGSTLYYLPGDHLGSTSITTNSSGALVSELRYKPWGEVRYPVNGQNPGPSKYTFTGQREEASIGLMFYNARWYDPYLNHFTQPDSIVPDQYNSLDWDRYAYARYNPLRYTDPSGHIGCDDQDENGKCINYEQDLFRKINKNYSDWERQILRKLFNEGGPDAKHGVEYIVAHDIHIEIAAKKKLGRPAWFDSDTVYVVLDDGKTTVTASPWALANVIHEALHIEQGFALSHSIEGERLAWQAGLRVYQKFSPGEFGLGKAYSNVLNATDTTSFLNAMWDPEYKVQMLTFYPEYPGGACHAGLLWCLYLEINSSRPNR